MNTCNICTRPASNPFRVFDANGNVVMGCIDAFHDGQLVVPSASARWHARPEAKKWRAAMAKHRKSL